MKRRERRAPARHAEAERRRERGLQPASVSERAKPSFANPAFVSLPLRFILTGILSLLVAIGWIVARPDVLSTYHYNLHVLAVTHLIVLGWICSVVMGAIYQLVPVALETKLYSERLAKWQFALHVIAFVGMVWMFRRWDMKNVGHFGTVMAVSVGLFVCNIARTLARVPRWNVVATAVSAALGWISFTILAGLSIAAGKCTYDSESPLTTTGAVSALMGGLRSVAGYMRHFDAISTMHAHAHVGAIGFFTMLIVGVSYKLIPMFTLSEVQSRRRASLSVALLNIGLAGSFVTILLRSPWKLAFALVVIVALVTYGCELSAILRARKRQKLDWGIKYFLTAIALLAPLSAIAAVLSWPGLPLNPFTGQLENIYGLLGLVGVVSFAILGMLYKILPFLVWFGRYSQHVGRAQVPALAEMYSPRLQAAGYWTFLGGLLVTVLATALSSAIGVRCGAGFLAVSLVLFATNVAKILAHFFRPQLKPLAFKPSLAPKPA